MKKQKLTRKQRYQRRFDSEGSKSESIQSSSRRRDAAVLRKLGSYLDSADVEGVDDGPLSVEHALYLRSLGWLVLDEEIDFSANGG
jgi:hypothetical protein